MDMDRDRAAVLNDHIDNITGCELYEKCQEKQTESHAAHPEYTDRILGKHDLFTGKRQRKTGRRTS